MSCRLGLLSGIDLRLKNADSDLNPLLSRAGDQHFG